MARGLTAVVGLLATLGWLVRWPNEFLDVPMTVLWVAPLGLLGLSSYGGEILFRVFFFALPCMAFYVGALVLSPDQGGTSWRRGVATGALSALPITGFLFACYGHEDSNFFAADEVAAARFLDAVAPNGTLLVEAMPNYPSRFSRYEQFVYVPLIAWPRGSVEESENAYSLGQVVEMMTDPKYPAAFLVVTDSQPATLSVPGRESIAEILREIEESGRFEMVYESPDARIYTIAASDSGASQ